jgi:DNA-directed RNA polymerase specialized sigma24 family protein
MSATPIATQPAPSATESLSDLVWRVAGREEDAFGRLYRRLVRPVYAQVLESVGRAAAVPVTRAVFVEVWRLAPVSGGRHVDVSAWVYGIAARRSADWLRTVDCQPLEAGMGDSGMSYAEHLGRELAAVLDAESFAGLGMATMTA